MILNKNEIAKVLQQSLPDLTPTDIHRTVQALSDANEAWREVDLSNNLGADFSIQCRDICAIGEAAEKGLRIRAFISEIT